jgi:hypothetical protein
MQVLKALNRRQLLKPFSTAFQHQSQMDLDFSEQKLPGWTGMPPEIRLHNRRVLSFPQLVLERSNG